MENSRENWIKDDDSGWVTQGVVDSYEPMIGSAQMEGFLAKKLGIRYNCFTK